MASHLIGLLGRKRSGKDTFAARLVEAHGYTRFAFADALREAALKLDPLILIEQDEYHLYRGWAFRTPYILRLSTVVDDLGWERAKEIREVRRTLQNMGVGVRDLDPDFWLRMTMVAVDNHPGPAVITDVRFPNELDAVHALGGWTVRVRRPGLPMHDLHISETALDDAAVALAYQNAGTVADLHGMADQAAYFVHDVSQ